MSSCMNSDTLASAIRNHPIYWFEDGTLLLDIECQRFRVHRTLLCRHSRFFSKGSMSDIGVLGQPVTLPNCQMRAKDIEALLQHLYHDMPLDKDSPFAHLASILRITSPQQLDFPRFYATARQIIEGMVPDEPAAFTHNYPLLDALTLATDFNLKSVRKAVFYSLVTTTNFDVTAIDKDPHKIFSSLSLNDGTQSEMTADSYCHPRRDHLGKTIPTDEPISTIAPDVARICTTLLSRIIDHFTPILFTPAATPHMECTDVFAETWLSLVIKPAIEADGVYKPLETLEKMKDIYWPKHGLCASCTKEKEMEWSEEQKTVWRLLDSWLPADLDVDLTQAAGCE